MRPHSVSVWVMPLLPGPGVSSIGSLSSSVAVGATDGVAAAAADWVGLGVEVDVAHPSAAIETATRMARHVANARGMASSGRVAAGDRHRRTERQNVAGPRRPQCDGVLRPAH